MADFATEAELAITVPNSEVRSARQTIEDGIGSVEVGVSTGGGASRLRSDGGGGGRGGRQSRRMYRWARQRTSDIETAVELLGSIEDKVGGGGGAGLAGGLLGGLGLRSAAGTIGGAVGGGAVTGGLSVAASKVINLTKSSWPASKVIALGKSAWKASKVVTLTAGTWAAGKLISIGSALTAGAGKLISVGSALTVGAGALVAIGSVLTLDAIDVIDIGAAIERDWDDVITLRGSVPFEAGQDFRSIFEGFQAASSGDLSGFGDPELPGGPAATAERNNNARNVGRETRVNSSPTFEINHTENTEQILDELRRERDRELEELERRIENSTNSRRPGR